MTYREVRRILCEDQNGEVTILIERRKVIRGPTLLESGRATEMLGSYDLVTITGRHANYCDDGSFELLDDGRIVKEKLPQ